MKYCSHCGKEVNESAVICMNCGCAVKPSEPIGRVNVDPQQRAAVIETLSQRLNVNGIIWIIIGVLQIIFGLRRNWFLLVVGVLNIVSAARDISYGKKVLTDQSEVIKRIEPLATPIITLIYNILFGGLIGIVGSIYYLAAIRSFVMKNRAFFEPAENIRF